ncbi:hypothetical protein BCV72DRAFT_245834 [Rhizopus microsporus var. microsporus]|uniref:Man1/Src1-like C-terminal domain-containing protein n=1 Tax=Rhizopus microsporus var. microsporus TaxID=86635 RepID=A0A1X0QPA8_RHIZD|nr:hypothetical protein BCV72DRAFT_245834 [Rhizopus microsporus var. microsporus]
MSSQRTIPEELYYLRPNHDLRRLRKAELKDILMKHGVPYGSLMTRTELLHLFKNKVLSRRDDIIDTYYTTMNNQNLIDADGFVMPTSSLNRKPVYPYGAEDSFAESEDDAPVHEPSSSSSATQYISDSVNQWFSSKQQDRPEKNSTTEIETNAAHFDPYDSFVSDNDELAIVPTTQLSYPGTTNDDNKPNVENELDVKQVDTCKSSPEPKQATSIENNPDAEPVTIDDEEQDVTDEDRNSDASYEVCTPSSGSSHSSYASEDSNDQSSGDEDDSFDSDYYPDDESDDESDKDNDELRKGIDEKELVYLQSDSSLPPESLRQLYEQRQAYSERFTVRKMIMVIINTCVSYFPFNARNHLLPFRFLFTTLALSLILFLMIVTLFRYKNGYCSNHKAQGYQSLYYSYFPSTCIPCPQNGICVNGKLNCEPIYVRQRPLYNPGGLLPIADKCVHTADMIRQINKAMKHMEQSLTTAQGNLIYNEYKRNLRHQELPQNIAAFYQSDFLDEMKKYINNDELTTTEVYGILNLALKKLTGHPTVYVWENKDGVPMIGTTSAIFPFRYYLLRASCRLFYSDTRYIILSVILTAVAIPVVAVGKVYIKRRHAYKDKINRYLSDILVWLRDPHEFYVQRPARAYQTLKNSGVIPVDTLRAELMHINEDCSVKDWDQVVNLVHKNPNVLRTIYEVQGHLVECWGLTPVSYIPQRSSILQTIVNRFF